MGFHPTAYLIVGFEVSKVFKPVSETRTIKKYNEDTGEPYELEVEDYFLDLPNGKRVAVEKPEEDGGICECDHEDLTEGLEFFYASDEVQYIGFELGRIETNWYERHNTEHTVAGIDLKIQALRETLKSLGWKKELTPAIAVHLVM